MRSNEARHALAALEAFDEDAYALTMRLAAEAAESDGALVVTACCWLLAGLAVQAEREGHRTIDEAVELITRQLRWDIEHFRKVGIH